VINMGQAVVASRLAGDPRNSVLEEIQGPHPLFCVRQIFGPVEEFQLSFPFSKVSFPIVGMGFHFQLGRLAPRQG
jgi:hypothetical protein